MNNDFRYASVNGIRLAYEQADTAYPLLLIQPVHLLIRESPGKRLHPRKSGI
jgi:hypothetical protein